VEFDPAACIDQEGEASGVGFGESVFAESADLVENGLCKIFGESFFEHTIDEFSFELIDDARASPGGHSASKLVSFTGSEVCCSDGQSHRLFLEDRDTHCFSEDLSDGFGGIGGLFAGLSSGEVGVYHITLDGSWSNDCDFDH
jgi:hypothetical protein